MESPADVPPFGATEGVTIYDITPSNAERHLNNPEHKSRIRPHSQEIPPLQKKDSRGSTPTESRPTSPVPVDRKERSGSESSVSSNHHHHSLSNFFRLKSPSGHVLHNDTSTIDQLFSADSHDEEMKQDAEASPQTHQPSPTRPILPPPIAISPRMEDYSEHHHILNTINEDEGESSILQDIERKANFGGLGSGSGGSAGGTISELAGYNNPKIIITPNNTTTSSSATPNNRNRTFSSLPTSSEYRNSMHPGRKNSQDSQEYMMWENMSTPLKGLRYMYVHLIATLRYLTPGLSRRINVYFMLFFLLVIAMVSQKNRPYLKMLELYACTIALELGTSMFDRLIYFVIDMVFAARFDIAYQLHSLNGPLGYLVAIYIMRIYWGFLQPLMIFKEWNSFLNSAAVLVICLAAKNWLIRKQYVHLLETRFTSKVENLNTMIIILSELASTRPPRSAKLMLNNNTIRHNPTSSDNLAAGASHIADTITSKMKNVFTEIVENTAEEEAHEEVITRKELYQRQRHFWQSAARLNATAGRMKVITYNGVVNIHNQNQAKEFGRKLFKHLSKGGKVVITPELIRRLFEERCEIVNRDLDEKADHDLEMQKVASKPASTALYQSDGEISDLWSKAVAMFDPFSLGRISEDFCSEAVLNIYKEQRFTAASISDFGELHQSLIIGIDIVYWLVMLMVLQSTLGFDFASYLLPFVTLLLSFSFAIASLVGNVFLAMAFVFFMSPYDVGHKVQIGLVSSSVPPPLGFVKSVSLLYTVINTTKNETIKIPNHSLWSEKIYNLSETTGATHEFAIVFNINGNEGPDGEKIKLFFTRLKHFTLRESKEWKSFFLAVFSMSIPDNTIEYRVYCAHREGWGLATNVAIAKIDYYAQIKKLREDLNLYFVKVNLPVLLNNAHSHGHSDQYKSYHSHTNHSHNNSHNNSVMSSPAESPANVRCRSANVDINNPPPLPDPEMLAHRHIPAALLSFSAKSEGSNRNKMGSPINSNRKSSGKKDK